MQTGTIGRRGAVVLEEKVANMRVNSSTSHTDRYARTRG